MSVKKSIILREILENFATPAQLQDYDILASRNKGSATHAALRLIQGYFEKKKTRENTSISREKATVLGRTIKINGNGRSWLQDF